jgi:hypothetical protein
MRMVARRAENGNDPDDVRRRLSYAANGRSVSIGSVRVARKVSINAAKARPQRPDRLTQPRPATASSRAGYPARPPSEKFDYVDAHTLGDPHHGLSLPQIRGLQPPGTTW